MVILLREPHDSALYLLDLQPREKVKRCFGGLTTQLGAIAALWTVRLKTHRIGAIQFVARARECEPSCNSFSVLSSTVSGFRRLSVSSRQPQTHVDSLFVSVCVCVFVLSARWAL